MYYRDLNTYYKEKFGCKIYKLSLDGGLSCPNRDGTIDTRGCIFCSDVGSGEFAEKQCDSITLQLEGAKALVKSKNKGGKYIAYFQSFTNTYGDISYLRKIYFEAIAPDYIVGLSIATRPDCIPDEVLELIKEVNSVKPVTIELGLQTSNDKTAEFIRRGYKTEVFDDCVKRLKNARIETVAHIIIGLPNERAEDVYKTVRHVGALGVEGVKLHLLYIIEGTDLATVYKEGRLSSLTLREYTDILENCIRLLPRQTVIHRLTGDGAKRSLLAPLWSADKKKVLNYIKGRFTDDDVEQGELWGE